MEASDSMDSVNTNIAILGGGPAGYVAAIRAAQLGAEVVLIEEKELGGVCLNIGCIPTKALLKTSDIAITIKKSKEFGIESSIENIDWNVALGRKNRVVKNLNTGVEQLLHANGVTIIKGRGSVISEQKVVVQTEEKEIEVSCKKLILTTGAVPMIPPIEGINLEGVITSNEALSLDYIPESVVIIGGGVIGLEFASMWSAIGTKITVIEQKDCTLMGEDKEVADELMKLMKRQGIAFKLSALVTEIIKTENGLAVTYNQGEKVFTQSCETVLVAVGRKLNSDVVQNLQLNIKNGAVIVDEHMETNKKGVYAAGDLVGGKLLAHLAFMEGKVAAENALGISSKVNYQAVPACVYTNPEIASVGMTEAEAIEAGIVVKVGRFNFRNNGRALTLGEREGFVKVIADQENTIIGGQILGTNASEMISEITLAITLKAKADILSDMIHPHPSLTEAVWEACGDLLGRAIHKI